MRAQEFNLAPLPDDPKAAIALLNQHIGKLNGVIADLLSRQASVVRGAPLRPRIGMVAYADGTVWNPGAGEGHYEFRSDGLWYKM